MTQQHFIAQNQYDNHNPPHNLPKYFDLSEQKFKKYTMIEADRRKAKQYFSRNSSKLINVNKMQDLFHENDQSNKIYSSKYKQKQQKHSESGKKSQSKQKYHSRNSNLQNVITIIDSDEQLNSCHQRQKNRAISLKAYLDKKYKQKNDLLLILPKIGKSQSIVQIVQAQLKLSKSKRQKNEHQLKTKTNNTIDQPQTLEYQNKKKGIKKHTLQNQLIHHPIQHQIINSLHQSRTKVNSINSLQPSQSANEKKRKIQLFGERFNPIERRSEAKLTIGQQHRHQRSIAMNLLSTELIYNNPKASINKSVYQQLIKRGFSSG